MKLRAFLKKVRDRYPEYKFKSKFTSEEHMIVYQHSASLDTPDMWLFGGWINNNGTVEDWAISFWLGKAS